MTGEAVRARGWVFWTFIILMLALEALFISLGTWQLHRLGEKEALIAAVDARFTAQPQPFPSAAIAPAEAEAWNFAPVTLAGHYLPAETTLVFTSLASPKGQASGPGYWVVTPFVLDAGGTVFVNLGFVTDARAPEFLAAPGVTDAPTTITGIARLSEETGPFTPAADPAKRVEWVRNTQRLALMAPGLPEPIAPLYVDLPAGPPGALPQGGETVVEFPNRHLEYAGTWYAFALITPILLATWIWRQRKRG